MTESGRVLSPIRIALGVACVSVPGCSNELPARTYSYAHLDVFTDTPLTGNQLAVFLEPQGLAPDEMMALTREMAFSETTFVFPAETPETDFRVRIFGLNTGGEIPVAGHPTIGAVFALAEAGRIEPGRRKLVLGLGIGPTTVDLTWAGPRLEFAWMAQRLPVFGGTIADLSAVASGLGIAVADIVATGLPVQQVSCGAPYLLVPVSSRAAVDRANLDRAAIGKLIDDAGLVRRGIFIFSLEPGKDGGNLYSRNLGFGILEDPATGNASGSVGAYLAHYHVVSPETARSLISVQGVKMGRPSRVHVAIEMAGDEITGVRVGGAAVEVSRAMISVPRHL